MWIRALRATALLGLSLFFCVLIATPLVQDTPRPQKSDQLRAALHERIGHMVARDAARIFGEDSPQSCVANGYLAAIIHPDTPPERVAEILRNLPINQDGRYALTDRWTTTAIDGDTGNTGRPINLTYSFLDDGVIIPGSNGEASSPSQLYQVMNGHFGSERVWKDLFAEIFNDWGKHIGVTYQEVSDDGAPFPASPGVLGARGDVRIGSHPVDGSYGVLAYNFYPDLGDMVLDSSENWSAPYGDYVYMRNIVRHEHGHGLGFGHVSPTNCQKLMEAFACTNFDGPQDDDIRGAMRNYGDTLEQNNNAATATDLGLLDGRFAFEWPVSLTTSVDFDYYRFSTAGPALLDVTVEPVGSTYNLEGVIVNTEEIMDLTFRVLGGENGSDILVQVDDVGVGEVETLTDFPLDAAGDYWVMVYRAAGTPDVQRYDLRLDVEVMDATAVAQGDTPGSAFAPTLYPNPFNPQTTMRFYADHAGPVDLAVYDIAGRLVREIDGHAGTAGWQELRWDGRTDGGLAAPSGTYLLRARAGQQTWTTRGVLVE
jgi:hypothetical protein